MPTQWTIGDVSVTKVVEQVRRVPLGGMLPAATPEALVAHADWLRPHFIDDDGCVDLSIHSFVVESDGLRILVDTCVGDREIPGMPGLGGSGDLPTRLAEAGFPDGFSITLADKHGKPAAHGHDATVSRARRPPA